MSVYNCDPTHPSCLFDFTFKHKIPDYFAYKTAKKLTDYMMECYFPDNKLLDQLAANN